MKKLRVLAIVYVVFLPAISSAQLWSGIINPTRAANWQRANIGVPGGIPTNYTKCGSTITSGSSAATINSAIAACGANTYILLGAGTFNLSASIDLRGKSNFILRGSGPTQTILNFTGADVGGTFGGTIYAGTPRQINSESADTQPGGANSCTWTAGFAQGTSSITLTNCGATGILNGDIIILDQKDDTSDTNGYLQCSTTSPLACMAQNSVQGRVINGIPWSQEQFVQVVSGCSSACNGSGPYTLTITPGLYANNWSQGNGSGNTGAWFMKPVKNIGIESLTVDDTNAPNAINANSGIVFFNVHGGWVKNIRSMNTRRNHVYLVNASRSEVRDSYFFGVKNSASQSYGIETFPADDCLIENNIFQQTSTPFMPGGGAGNVWGYNFSRNNPVGVGYTYMQTSYTSHTSGNYMTLFEGNYINGLEADQLHGTSGMVTVFRNWIPGLDWNIFAPGDMLTSNQTYPFDFNSYNRGYNIIGNVLGTPGYHNRYESYAPNSTTANQCNHSIYNLGFSGGVCDNNDMGGVADDARVRSTLMRWGNYDVVNAAVRWDATESSPAAVTYIAAQSTPVSHTLPASFYLSSKPSWFGSLPYPLIGPDVTGGPGPGGYAYQNPAATCYFTTMGGPTDGSGSVLNFDATTCYSAAVGPPTSPGPLIVQ